MFADESGTRPSRIGRNNNSAVNYDYNTFTAEKNNYYVRPPSFNEDTKFSWWKSHMFIHIIGVDDKMWDIIEDGVNFFVDVEGMVIDKKRLNEAQRKIYSKHHIVHGIFMDALPKIYQDCG